MNLSFALTANEFLSGKKTVTRRFWKPRTLRMWQRAWDNGRKVHNAFDKGTHRGGKKIGQFELTARPYLEPLSQMTPAELEAEGGMVTTVAAFCKLVGKPRNAKAAVVRFRKS